MTATIRLARQDEVDVICALIESAYRGDSARQGWTHEADLLSGDRTSEAEIAAVLADPDARLLVAEEGGALAGTATISRKGETRAYLGALAVNPAVQAAGLGRALIAAAEAEARTAFGASVMEMTVIEVRTDLIGWYERRGYRRSGETRPFPYVPGEPVDFAMTVLERTIA